MTRDKLRGSGRIGTTSSHTKQPLLPIAPSCTHPALSFASKKRTKAFYSATENAPFAVNPTIRAFLEKMCKNVPVFASNSEKWVSGEVIRALIGPGFIYGIVCLPFRL